MIFDKLLSEEYALGNYLKADSVIKISSDQRRRMVLLIEELRRKKNYRHETLFLAVSIADRYLIYLSVTNHEAPCLVNLAATCLLISAKLNQPLRPKFELMR